LIGLIRAKLGKTAASIGAAVGSAFEAVGDVARRLRYSAMDREAAVTWIKTESKGRIFVVDFIKRTNGAKRHMVCRYGVKMNIKGVGLSFDPTAKQLIVVWDVEKGAWRMINIPGMRGILITPKKADRADLLAGSMVGQYFVIR
jgi:hypothetical protein